METWDYEDLKEMVDMDSVDEFRRHALNPNHPCQRGSAQNPDIFFQAREACNPYYEALPVSCTHLDVYKRQTGVTVILPCEDNPYKNKLTAAAYIHNGFGKSQGLVQMEELDVYKRQL